MRCRATSIVVRCWPLWLLVATAGCGSGTAFESGVVGCQVLIDDAPASDVRVVMTPTASTDTNVVLEGVTDHSGVAQMKLVDGAQFPLGDQVEFSVAVESLGDWVIAKPWADVQKSPLKVVWSTHDKQAQLQVVIPRKAVKAL